MIVDLWTPPTPDSEPYELNATLRLPAGAAPEFIAKFTELLVEHGGKLQASELRKIKEAGRKNEVY